MPMEYSFPGPTGLTTTYQARRALGGLIASSTTGAPRPGILPSHSNPLVTSRADMNVNIWSFVAAAVQFGGVIFFANNGSAQLPAPLVSPGAGTNYYVIYAKQNESASPGTDANNNTGFDVKVSTSSFAAARALMPAGALEIATVEMPTGKTATGNAGVVITQTHQYTAAQGGVVWFRNTSERDAWAAADGTLGLLLSEPGSLYQSGGGVWARVVRRPLTSAITLNANNFYGQTVGALPLAVVRDGNRNYLQGALYNVQAPITFAGGTAVTIGSIPSSEAPAETVRFMAPTNVYQEAQIRVLANGNIEYVQSVTGTYNSVGSWICWLEGMNWPAKA